MLARALDIETGVGQHNLLEEGHERFPKDLRLQHLYCLSLIKCGFLVEARARLSGLVKQGHVDEETHQQIRKPRAQLGHGRNDSRHGLFA